MVTQKTLARNVVLSGVGLHTGMPVSLELRPAAPDYGIRFIRTDLPSSAEILAHPNNVTDTDRSTTLGKDGVNVRTVEHLMAALYGLGITNCFVMVSAEELPILDGSSAQFVDAIRTAGCVDQRVPARTAKLTATVLVERESSLIAVSPSNGFSVVCVVSYPGTPIGVQVYEYTDGRDDFASSVAPSRTVGFTWEIEELLSRGLARGGSLECAVVADESKYITELRFDDEVARHKVLDTVGDLYLMGIPRMRAICVRNGHRLNNELCRRLLLDGALKYEW